jgi:hypothetical protein
MYLDSDFLLTTRVGPRMKLQMYLCAKLMQLKDDSVVVKVLKCSFATSFVVRLFRLFTALLTCLQVDTL